MTFMNSVLDHRSPATDHVFKISIALSTYPFNPTIEPLPKLDYLLIYQLVAIARPHLNKHQLKSIEYMVDARGSFYVGHHKCQVAYRDLLDAYACAEILDRKVEELRRRLEHALTAEGNGTATVRQHLCAIEIQRRSNNEDMRICLARLRAKTKNRQKIAALFSNLKFVFLKNEMPWLVALGKQRYDWAMRQGEERGSLPAPRAYERRAVDRDDSDHCSDSGGTSTPDVEMQDFGLGLGVSEGEDGGML
ncbi:MAG: hypothetical protein Q9161_006795 [Pseudevernia consocians]